jgi:multidrug efflux pump subunit AcrA (membrane-fusion protein)
MQISQLMKTQTYQRYLIALVGLSLASCSGTPPQAGVKALPVPISTVEPGIVTDSSDYVANLQSRQSITLQPRINGYVKEIYVKAGDSVQAGTPILRIDSNQQQAVVQQASASLATSQAELQSAKATLNQLIANKESVVSSVEFNQTEFKRFSQLTSEGAATKQRLDEASNNLRNAKSQLGQAKAQIAAQQANIDSAKMRIEQSSASVTQAQVQLDFYTVNAPFPGTIGTLPIKVGDIVSSSTELTTITQNQLLEVQIAVPVEKAPRLRMGMTMQLLNEQDQPITDGKVSFISPSINQQSQSVLVKANFNNDRNQLRVNQFVRARLVWDSKPGILVPTTAISRLGGQDFIFVAESKGKDGQLIATQKTITLGRITGNKQEVLKGLEVNDKIVVSGLARLRDGIPIAPEGGS